MRISNLAVLLAALALLALVLGRLAGLPVAVVMVSGRSMEPSLRLGDLVVAVRSGFGVGDVVIWCTSPTYCVVHRVVNVTDGLIVTKGDNNPVPDAPVPRGLVRYRVVLTIPRELWAPPALLLVGVYAYRRRRALAQVQVGRVAVAVLLSYFLFSLTLALLAPTYFTHNVAPLRIPSINLRSARLWPGGLVALNYTPLGASIEEVEACLAVAGGLRAPCAAEGGGDGLVVKVPTALLEYMNEHGLSILEVRLNATLSCGQSWRGRLVGRYLVPVPWRPLRVEAGGGVVRIYNPNPAAVRVNVTFMWADEPGPWSRSEASLMLGPGEEAVVEAPRHRYVYADVRYVLAGSIRGVRVRP